MVPSAGYEANCNHNNKKKNKKNKVIAVAFPFPEPNQPSFLKQLVAFKEKWTRVELLCSVKGWRSFLGQKNVIHISLQTYGSKCTAPLCHLKYTHLTCYINC